MRLSIEKCTYLQIGYRNLDIVYLLNSEILTPCDSIVDLGVNVQTNLKSGPHCTAIVSKASARCRLILKSFLSRDPFILARPFVVYVRPILEYCAPVWSPYFMQDIDLIEGVQCTFTRNLYRYCHLEHITYDERLHFLGLQRLELRLIHIDLIFMFKLTHNMLATSLSQSLQFTNHAHATRSH